MSDLISRSALLESLIYCKELQGRRTVEVVAKVINEQPIVDAEPVRHGEWLYKNYIWHCSLCDCRPYKGYIPVVPTYDFALDAERK